MEFNDQCVCCRANQLIFMKKKTNQSLAARRYYTKNRDKIVVDTLKKYYKRKQQSIALKKKITYTNKKTWRKLKFLKRKHTPKGKMKS